MLPIASGKATAGNCQQFPTPVFHSHGNLQPYEQEDTGQNVPLAEVMVNVVAGLATVLGEVGEEVPFLGSVVRVVKKLHEHVKNAKQADAHVAEAGRRATATQDTVETLAKARFPVNNGCYRQTLETLGELMEMVAKWSDKGFWQKRLGVSLSKGKTTAQKYSEAFETLFQVQRAFSV